MNDKANTQDTSTTTATQDASATTATQDASAATATQDASAATVTQDASAASALIGEPTGDSLSRRRVDDLEFSAAQQKRPGGMSRPEYLRSRPGETTRQLVIDAGMLVSRRRLGIVLAVGGVALIAALLVLFSFFWL